MVISLYGMRSKHEEDKQKIILGVRKNEIESKANKAPFLEA